MASFDFKTATPASASASALIFGAESQAAATPSIYNTTGSGTVVLNTSPTLVTPTLGVASATSVNKVTITAPASSATLTIANGKTLTANASLTLAGTDSTTMTFPSTSTTIAGLGVQNTFTGTAPQISLGANSGALGTLKFFGSTSGDVTVKAAAAAGTATVFQLPASNGTNGYVLSTDGAGVTSWIAATGSPAGSNTQVQFNSSGSFGASANLTWSSPALTIGAQQTTQGQLVLANTAAGAFATTIQASNSASAAWTLTLPTTAGTNGYVLSTNGSGVTSWVAQSGSSTLTVGSTATSGGAAGQIMFDTGSVLQESSGLVWDNTNKAISTLGGGTVTTSNPVINATQTWNAVGTTFTGLKLNVTSTASAAASLLMDLQIASSSVFKVDKTGAATSAVTGAPAFIATGVGFGYGGSTQLDLYSSGSVIARFTETFISSTTGADFKQAKTGTINWTSGAVNGTVDTTLSRGGTAATLQLGAADAASPVAQTLQVQSVVAGTTDGNGAAFNIGGSKCTGAGTAGVINIQTSGSAATGTTQNALATVATFGPSSLNGSQTTSALSISQAWATTGAPTLLLVNASSDTGPTGSALLADFQAGGVSKLSISKTGAVTANSSLLSKANIGYTTGAGGTVTQTTSRTTGVTLNKSAGQITLVSAAGDNLAWTAFTFTNSQISGSADVVYVTQKSGTDVYQIVVSGIASGSCVVNFKTTGGTTTEQPVFNFVVIKGATA